MPKPILKWSNPVRGSVHGDALRLDFERPSGGRVLVSRVVPANSKQRGGILFAVARAPGGRSSRQPPLGLQTRRVSSSSRSPMRPRRPRRPPSDLRQIRELAKDFTAHQVTPTGVDYEMRLLLQPIFHYEGTEGDLIDWALFAIVHATDPEVFLQIEWREVGGVCVWQICPGPLQQQFNHRQPQGTRDLDRPADRSLRQGPRSPRTLHEHYCRAQPAVIVVFRKYSVDTACGVAIFVVIRRVP